MSFVADSSAAVIPSFSYQTVITGQVLTIPIYQQMVVANEFVLDGEIILIGDLALV